MIDAYTQLEYNGEGVSIYANKTILAIEALRKAGIGDLLKREGLMTEEEELRILETLDVH